MSPFAQRRGRYPQLKREKSVQRDRTNVCERANGRSDLPRPSVATRRLPSLGRGRGDAANCCSTQQRVRPALGRHLLIPAMLMYMRARARVAVKHSFVFTTWKRWSDRRVAQSVGRDMRALAHGTERRVRAIWRGRGLMTSVREPARADDLRSWTREYPNTVSITSECRPKYASTTDKDPVSPRRRQCK